MVLCDKIINFHFNKYYFSGPIFIKLKNKFAMKQFFVLILTIAMLWGCHQNTKVNTPVQMLITEDQTNEAIQKLAEKLPGLNLPDMEKGVRHAASLWRETDGSPDEFVSFCVENYIGDSNEKQVVFLKISDYLETLFGHFTSVTINLKKNVDLQTGQLHPVDHMFSAYSMSSHFNNDFYNNKIAFLVALNFPYYSTEEKNERAGNWSELEWAYARLGDVFSSRIPAELIQKSAAVSAEADAYIAEYNIYMGKLRGTKGESLFPENMVLLSHWNLRDEIKANYGNATNGLEKQEIIYRVMQRIVDQSIPQQVINSGEFDWNPYENSISKNEAKSEVTPEPDNRYQQIINNFNALKALIPTTRS
jgi:hypothetical protein